MTTRSTRHLNERSLYSTRLAQQVSASKYVVIGETNYGLGLPKPITMTNGTFATMDNDRNLPDVQGRKRLDFTIWDFSGGGKFYTAFPPFHVSAAVINEWKTRN